jgi:DNA-binding CsgD family transcriptional regulator
MPPRQTPIIDAAYALGTTDDEWLDRLLYELRGELGVTKGNAYFYRSEQTATAGRVEFGATILHAVGREFFEDSHVAMPRNVLSLYGETRATSLSSDVPMLFESDPFIRDAFPKVGVADMLALCAVTQSHADDDHNVIGGCMITVYLPPAGPAAQRVLSALQGAARHLELGIALRMGDEGDEPLFVPVDGSAIWRGVLEGTWRLVSFDDLGGERRMIVRACDPSSRHALQREERYVLELAARGISGKAIAIELGVVESVASKLLRRGMRKVGARTRAELVALLDLTSDCRSA